MITNRIKKIAGTIALITLFLLFFPSRYLAADESTGKVFGFNYKVDYPENQLVKDSGYFDLLMSPGQEQTVSITLSNSGNIKTTVEVSLNGTKTNPNGVLEYGTSEIKNDASLKFPFEEIVTAPEKVELAGGEVKKIDLVIKMPETSFDGIILGGIQLKQGNQETDEKAKGATVRNEYTYVVAMVLKNNETEVLPEIQINNATGAQRNFRNSVAINLSNSQATLVREQFGVEAQVMKKGSQEVLYERKQAGMSIAANSQMDFYVPMNGEKMVEGDYTANVLATIGEKKWEKKIDFTITREEADKYNKRDVGLVQDRGLDWKLVMLIVVSVLVVVIVVFVTVKLIQKKKKSSDRLKEPSKSRSSSSRSTTNKKK